ncbi:hypothetical protein ACQ4N7_26275 [Nodosilinea sp. AN01ver1]|uniref:hypothetical protein n=1 Tax=Nodosilinea sp. AN01ver1 TaxID=3423362 RepID=UPI003D30F029
MSRRIVTTQYQAATSAQVDTYFDKVVKYIPADIVSAWVAVSGLVGGRTDIPVESILWIAFILGLVITAVWMWKQTSVPRKKPAITQISISTVAFAIWVFALGGPFANLDFYQPVYGSLVLILYTLLVALIDPPEEEST